MVETKVIRIIVYLIGLYTFLSGLQLIMTGLVIEGTFSPWILTAVSGNYTVAYALVFASAGVGAVTLLAAWFNKRRFLQAALSSTAAYQILLFILNVLEYGGRGTPAIPALILGCIAALLCGYYSIRPEALGDFGEGELINDDTDIG